MLAVLGGAAMVDFRGNLFLPSNDLQVVCVCVHVWKGNLDESLNDTRRISPT